MSTTAPQHHYLPCNAVGFTSIASRRLLRGGLDKQIWMSSQVGRPVGSACVVVMFHRLMLCFMFPYSLYLIVLIIQSHMQLCISQCGLYVQIMGINLNKPERVNIEVSDNFAAPQRGTERNWINQKRSVSCDTEVDTQFNMINCIMHE